MEIHKTQFSELDLEVAGTYYKGQYATYETPPEPEMFEIEAVIIQDTNIDLSEMFENSYDKELNSWMEILEQQILDEQYR